ncbi:protein kinase [Nocardioides sp. R-C-SC26]|uniref:protein kinase domain-containing protein n=1 Tax=Nocardioides sp. R-C-SC26 TaxID=2870414 RepID=UPI001E419397|nr:protein kinase [Nocardioides sp. R-C-SC26]
MATALPRVGDIVGDFRLLAPLGHGGTGVVFLAASTLDQSHAAVKLLPVAHPHAGEAQTLGAFDSPHIVPLLAHGTTRIGGTDYTYVATAHVAGGDLGALIHARGPMPARLAVDVCVQVASALALAHDAGVVHRDVKPTNVLLEDADATTPHAYLCDFGLAHRIGQVPAGHQTAIVGTWSYLAPELDGGAAGTPASDVYALGCLLWACLSGAPPYRGTDAQISEGHRTGRVPQLLGGDEFTARVNQVLQRSLAKDPAGRYPDAGALLADLADAAAVPSAPAVANLPAEVPNSEPASTPTPETTSPPASRAPLAPTASAEVPPAERSRPREWPSRGVPTLAVALATALALLVVALIAWWAFAGDDDPKAPASPTAGSGEAPASPTETPTDPAPAPTGVTGDLDGDGLGDVSVDHGRVLRRGGAEREIVESTTWLSTGRSLAAPSTAMLDDDADTYVQRVAGHFDDDGALDVLEVRTPSDRSAIQVRGTLSSGASLSATLAHPGRRNLFAHVVDSDGDGRDDLAFTSLAAFDTGGIQVLVARFDGAEFAPLREAASWPPNADRTTLGSGDVDGDGRDDVVTLQHLDDPGSRGRQISSRLAVHSFDDDGTLSRRVSRPIITAATPPLRLADVDGDGREEIVVVDALADDRLRLGVIDLDAGTLKRPVWTDGLAVSAQVEPAVGVSDVDGDGRDDIVIVGPTSSLAEGSVRVAFARGDGFRTRDVGAWGTRFNRYGNTDRLEYVGNSRL